MNRQRSIGRSSGFVNRHTLLSKISKFANGHPLLKKVIELTIGIFGIIGSIALSGVIGNSMYAIFMWFWENALNPAWERLTKPAMISLWPWTVIIAAILICLGTTTIYSWDKNRLLRQVADKSNQVIRLDDSLLRLLARLKPTEDLRDQTQRVLDNFLRDAIRTFPRAIYRASILLPDKEKDYLIPHAHYHMPLESIDHMRFYIGKDENRASKRGVAGTAYIKELLRVGHILRKNGRWECDLEDYMYFDPNLPHPSYYSFIVVPIIGIAPDSPQEDATTVCFGVICFDSDNPIAFDSPEIQKLLQIYGRRIAATLSIFMNLGSKSSQY